MHQSAKRSKTLSRIQAICIALLGILSVAPLRADIVYAERFGIADGKPIILIPGLGCGGDVWRGAVEALASDFDLHVLTLAGFAGKPPIEVDGPFLSRVRDAVAAYMEDQELERPTIVGHSLGAFLAFWIASEFPDRVGRVVAVDGLPFLGALHDPEATPADQRARAAQTRSVFASLSAEQFAAQTELSLRTMIRDPEEIARIARTSGASDPSTVGRTMAELLTVDLRTDLAKITAPILLIGAFGGLPGEDMRQLMSTRYRQQIAAAPQARFIEAPTLHFVMLDDLNFFLTELRSFLTEERR